jgi:hypothetical protein
MTRLEPHDLVHGRVLDCGHYLPEEAPEETYAELRAFFRPPDAGSRIAPAPEGSASRITRA